MSERELSKHYSPSDVEKRWLSFWQEKGYAHAETKTDGPAFAVTLPPPNVTGSLHMGHALGGTMQDILLRWKRMMGAVSMWMPGTDHAGIATQMMVERDLKRRENKTRHDLGRDAFLERMWKWKETYGGRIQSQLKLMGFTLDWERERFTMDEKSSRAVREAFVRLHEDGLIYRAHRLVNWCPDCFTAVSDLEVNNVDEKGKLWKLRYPLAEDPTRFLEVATTRPETMLGDTGVAVHPDDERYSDLVGKMVRLPLTNREIPVVADTFVDPEFGSGAVKVTPAHDFNDFECGARCKLPSLSIIGTDGCMTEEVPKAYVGLTALDARKKVIADLDAAGFLVGDEDYTVPVARCDRSNSVIQPLLSDQWWLKMEPLAKPAIKAVEEGRTKFVPELWTKTYMHWMKNIRDWTISRQLWWGHRIPAWFCGKCDHVTVERTDPTACAGCGSNEIRQDEDVLDTWFSSGLWPFSTLGWPEKTEELDKFYPNAVLVTAPDIIFFWVARMMMMGLRFAGDVPFKKVFLTPIVGDENGDKMSKVKGNVVDPLDVINGATYEQLLEAASVHEAATKYVKKHMKDGIPQSGADALRFSLAAMTMPGRNIRLSMERVEGYRNFVNKLWNASRFTLMNLEGFELAEYQKIDTADLAIHHRWILSRLGQVAGEVKVQLEAYRFSEAANTLYHFAWHEFCDWYIELSKSALRESGREKQTAQGTLATVLEAVLRLLHPFMPFVTEEIWQLVPKTQDAPESIVISAYPVKSIAAYDEEAEKTLDLVKEVTTAIRTLRSTYGVAPSKRVSAFLRVADAGKRKLLDAQHGLVSSLSKSDLTIEETGPELPQSAKSVVGADIEVVVPLEGLVDVDAERARIQKTIDKAEKEIAQVEKKLANKNFVDRAPAEVVAKETAKLEEGKERVSRLVAALKELG